MESGQLNIIIVLDVSPLSREGLISSCTAFLASIPSWKDCRENVTHSSGLIPDYETSRNSPTASFWRCMSLSFVSVFWIKCNILTFLPFLQPYVKQFHLLHFEDMQGNIYPVITPVYIYISSFCHLNHSALMSNTCNIADVGSRFIQYFKKKQKHKIMQFLFWGHSSRH